MTILEDLLSNVPKQNQAIIIPDGGPELNFEQLLSVIDQFKQDLAALGGGKLLGAQDAVSISLVNSLEYVVSFLAVAGNSLIAAPLNPNYKQSEFEFFIEDMKSKLLIVPKGSVKDNYAAVAAARTFKTAIAEVAWDGKKVAIELVETGSGLDAEKPLRASGRDDIAFVLHTSGTTGRPKAVPLLQRNMLASVRNIIGCYRLTQTDVSYLVMPLFHVHGLICGLFAALSAGGSVIIPSKFSASSFWTHWQQHGATWYTAVPTIHQILLKHDLPKEQPKIRFIRSCSSSLAPSVFAELEAKLKAPVLEAYAMTEACHQMTSNNLPPDVRKPGTIGIGHGVEVVILDDKDNVLPPHQEGEISIRGKNVTPGYLNNPKANAESFTKVFNYFRTGDQGKLDDDGLLIITGRIKELINRGGEKISPIELDSVMLSYPDVSEAVSFGVPDEMYGQQVNAVIVLKPGTTATQEDIQKYMSEKVAKYKVPVKVFFTDVMPKTATGKIQRRIIAEKFASN